LNRLIDRKRSEGHRDADDRSGARRLAADFGRSVVVLAALFSMAYAAVAVVALVVEVVGAI
jgi:hypothetical protein